MPLYSYICKKCRKEFDLLIRTIQDNQRCPYCQGEELEKLFSPFAISGSEKGKSSCASCSASDCSTCSG